LAKKNDCAPVPSMRTCVMPRRANVSTAFCIGAWLPAASCEVKIGIEREAALGECGVDLPDGPGVGGHLRVDETDLGSLGK
jgi:hypothetical protein